MADTFDPYREALVVETVTVWPDDLQDISAVERARISQSLHAHPENVGNLEYVRVHSGFCRKITVTSDDLARVAS
jgi:hypothetical protein